MEIDKSGYLMTNYRHLSCFVVFIVFGVVQRTALKNNTVFVDNVLYISPVWKGTKVVSIILPCIAHFI